MAKVYIHYMPQARRTGFQGTANIFIIIHHIQKRCFNFYQPGIPIFVLDVFQFASHPYTIWPAWRVKRFACVAWAVYKFQQLTLVAIRAFRWFACLMSLIVYLEDLVSFGLTACVWDSEPPVWSHHLTAAMILESGIIRERCSFQPNISKSFGIAQPLRASHLLSTCAFSPHDTKACSIQLPNSTTKDT